MASAYFVRNVLLLAIQWCFGLATFFIQVSTTSLAVVDITGNVDNATIPIGLMLGVAALTASMFPHAIAKFGSTLTFSAAAFVGGIGAVLNLLAVIQGQGKFLFLIFGGILQGVTYASSQNLRFAVLQFSTPDMASKAVGYVIAGGVFATVIGPEVSKHTRTSMEQEYAGSFLLLLGIYVGMMVVPFLVDFDGVGQKKAAPVSQQDTDGDVEVGTIVKTEESEMVEVLSAEAPNPTMENKVMEDEPRPLSAIVGRWQFIFMLTCQMVSYSAMAGLMVATPLSMKGRDFNFNESTSAIQFHMVGMFLPSFFTGEVVARVGKIYTMTLGFLIMLLGALLFYSGETLVVFWTAIGIVGVGWNFSFVPSTALMATLYRPCEKSSAQAFTDIFVVSSVATTITSAGAFYEGVGWRAFTSSYVGYIAVQTLIVLSYVLYCWTRGRPVDKLVDDK